ncbi:MAG: MFS transporter [Candidatus Omnitrophota bacterium]|nr:MAG: MFS transporter [Candidatus Omnitrophota bacterium]
MNIVSLYFVLWLTVDKECPELYYSIAFSGSVLLAACLMPILGEVSDKLKRRVPFLIAFTLGCVVFTAFLGLIKGTFAALLFFALANFCYQLAGVAYNSLLTQVSTPQTLGRTSGLGVSLGYVGTLLGLHLVRPFLNIGGRQATFAPTAALFLIFAMPAFIFIKDSPHPHVPLIELQIKPVFARLRKTLTEVRRNSSLVRFLIAAFLCLNAVNTIIIFMGVYAKRVINFGDAEIIYFMSVSTVFAIIGSYAFGLLTDRWGSKDTLNLVIKLWCLAIFLAMIASFRWMFWIVGPLAGVCLGATWVSARTMLIELVPEEKIGQMFGLFGLAGRFSSVLGPVVWGLITFAFAGLGLFKYRLAIASVFIFMSAGYFIFQGVEDPRKAELAT